MRTFSERSWPSVYRQGPGYTSAGPSYTQILICLRRLSPGRTAEMQPLTFYVEVYIKGTDSKKDKPLNTYIHPTISLNNIDSSCLFSGRKCCVRIETLTYCFDKLFFDLVGYGWESSMFHDYSGFQRVTQKDREPMIVVLAWLLCEPGVKCCTAISLH